MARYIGPMCKICDRERMKLFLKAERCYTKCPIDKASAQKKGGRAVRPSSKLSEYGKRLREKQRAKFFAGMLEKQFRKFFATASKSKGLTGETLLKMLEMRLDNIVRKLGFAVSQKTARQMVSHGHIVVNNRRVNIPSYQVKPGDVVALVDSMKENVICKKSLEDTVKRGGIPTWIELNADKKEGKIIKYPTRAEMSVPVEEQLIVELYSK